MFGQSGGASVGLCRVACRHMCSIRQHTSAYVSIRQAEWRSIRRVVQSRLPAHVQHTSAYVRQSGGASVGLCRVACRHMCSIRQHTSAYVSIRQAEWRSIRRVLLIHSPADTYAVYVSIRQHTSGHTSVYVSIRQGSPADTYAAA
jgi:alpha-D-ribose 1-methylphosphonate 5-triphosphate synthase subunit PhnL